jgi:hypothetical protein
MGSNRTRLVPVLIAALAIGVYTGCGEDEATTPPPESTGSPTPAPEPVVTKVQPPKSIKEQLAQSVDLPDFYPKDAPVYPGAKASSVGWQGTRVSAVFSTSDPVDQVVSHTRESLESQGWSDIQSSDLPSGQIVQGFKHDAERTIMALVSSVEEAGEKVTLIAVSTDPSTDSPTDP